ncbi:hypothetical protein BRARA_C01267 [Brassica rapa]|uniref:C2H2-type domain-containing protein n=1 Tax=Brassica campestris TaxID=3711 RepID=A0A397ZU61_BRACM|nr:hypothetical protein BRARA_C01267 [Brassica rapa]
MEQCYKDDCGSSLGFIVEKRKDIEKYQAEDDEKEPKSISLREEDNDDRANSIDLEGDCMSGKALGGHKRIHVLENQNKSGESEIDCSVCHKKFTSRKTLYGHMRFHPDRAWKGVLPPPPPPPPHPLGNSSSSTLSIDDHHVGEFTSSDHDDDDDDDGYDNIDAKDLMLLATTAEAVNLDVAETSDSHSAEDMKKKKKRRVSEIEKVSSSSSTHDHHQVGDVVASAAEEGSGAREKHVCVTCNKSFTSYQALGGHRASHNKAKILENHQARANSEALLLGTEENRIGLASAQASNTSLSSSNNGDHVCDICHKSFPTGQALGGHKRRHWTGPVSSEAATAPAAGSSSQGTETVQEVKKFEFDLNELPPNEG